MKKSFLFLLPLLAGCALTPPFARPPVDIPAAWSVPPDKDAVPVDAAWWKTFGSAELDGLMQQALANNNDIRAALHRVEQSRAALKISGASLLPAIDATASASRSRSVERGSAPSYSGGWRAGLSAGYELDLFGANRAGAEAARARLEGSGFDRDALALVVMGDVAKDYFALLGARARLEISGEDLKNARELLRIVNARFGAGAADGLELAQQKAAVDSAGAARASAAEREKTAENALAVLLGRAPQTVTFKGANFSRLTLPAVRLSQPSALVERRPDIRAAEAALRAANADIGAARAALFPQVSLGADLAFSGSPQAAALSVSSSLLAPIFHGGALTGKVEQANAREAELAETYAKTVLTAFGEVENALAAVRSANDRLRLLTSARAEAQRAYDLSKARYEAGTIDFEALLNAQSALLSAGDSLVQAKTDSFSAAADLFKALGGGWKDGA